MREHEGAGRGRGPFVVWGAAYATPNVGDMAIAQAIVRLLRRDDPKVEIAFVTSGRYKTHLSGFEGVSIVDLGRRPLRVLRLLRRAGLLLVAGGVPFGDSTAALVRFLIFAAAARLAGARIEVVASSAAEARLHPVNEALCRAILSLVRSTAVRDQKSLELLRRLKGEDAVDFVPDLALALDPQNEADTTEHRAFGLADDEPYVVIAPRNFLAGQHYLRTHFAGSFGRTEASALLGCLVAVAEALGRERRVVFLPMNVDEDDHVVGLRAAEQLAARGRAPIVIEDRLSVDQTCGLLKGADLVLGMRLHAVILAIAHGRPTVALGYAGKVTGFMEWLGLEDDLLALTAPSGRVLEACGRRLCQGVPPHVPAALALARQQIDRRFAASGQGPERSSPARSERVTTA